MNSYSSTSRVLKVPSYSKPMPPENYKEYNYYDKYCMSDESDNDEYDYAQK